MDGDHARCQVRGSRSAIADTVTLSPAPIQLIMKRHGSAAFQVRDGVLLEPVGQGAERVSNGEKVAGMPPLLITVFSMM
jgi:hypothetical protein